MTENQSVPAAVLAGYLDAMEDQNAPVLGHLVLYSVYEGEITPADVERWCAELGLDPGLAPGDIRPVDVFEKITGPSGIRRVYPAGQVQSPRQRRRDGARGREATLMIRHVSRDNDKIVRHLVREVRDEQQTRLSYDTRLAECAFRRDSDRQAVHGAGTLQLTPDRGAITALPAAEQAEVTQMLADIAAAFDKGRHYLTADRLRAMIRGYIESLHAIRVRPTGGVYFVSRQHAQTLAALRDLVARFGNGSHLARVPLPDQHEMRQMIISAFITRSKEELDRLARDIAAATRDQQPGKTAIQTLHKRFTDLQAATAEHEQLLGGSIDDARASMQLVQMQLAGLLAQAG